MLKKFHISVDKLQIAVGIRKINTPKSRIIFNLSCNFLSLKSFRIFSTLMRVNHEERVKDDLAICKIVFFQMFDVGYV